MKRCPIWVPRTPLLVGTAILSYALARSLKASRIKAIALGAITGSGLHWITRPKENTFKKKIFRGDEVALKEASTRLSELKPSWIRHLRDRQLAFLFPAGSVTEEQAGQYARLLKRHTAFPKMKIALQVLDKWETDERYCYLAGLTGDRLAAWSRRGAPFWKIFLRVAKQSALTHLAPNDTHVSKWLRKHAESAPPISWYAHGSLVKTLTLTVNDDPLTLERGTPEIRTLTPYQRDFFGL